MTGDWAFTPQIRTLLLTGLVSVALAISGWRRRTAPGARPFAAACLLASIWVAGAAAESMAVDPAIRVAWFKFQAVWQLPVVTAITCLVLEYANPGRWLSRRTLILLSLPLLLELALALTNDLHHWTWLGFSVGASVVPLRGPVFSILFAYSLCLMLVNLKTGATRKLVADGKLARADEQLAHLESIMADAHADVREYILNLRTAPTDERPFFAALRQYLEGFRHNYGIRVDLSVGAGVDDSLLAPEAQMQVLRIVQEAFSNVRKHAQTNRAQESFERGDRLVRVCVRDNGLGFDPQRPAGEEEGHLGLRFMRERTEQVGGTLRVESAPGQGTCVTVEVPLRSESSCS
jgi:two-component sensor histidine kinase